MQAPAAFALAGAFSASPKKTRHAVPAQSFPYIEASRSPFGNIR